MLTKLTIQNYALIESLHVSFNNGLSIITGETGAGKSILLGGLSLILGKRADLSVINDASSKCIVEATFDIANYDLKEIFKQEDLDYEPETIIRREILPSGKSRAFVNDSPVNLNILSILGEHLIDIHSQHQTLELTNNDFQFDILDALAKNQNILSDYKHNLSEYKTKLKNLEALFKQKSEAIKEHDYNSFLLNELLEAELKTVNLEDLEEEQSTLSNVEFVTEELSLSSQLLNEEQVGVLQNLSALKSSFAKLSGISKAYEELYNRIVSSYIELDDLQSEIEELQDGLELNPVRLEEVNAKLRIINNLMQKHSAESIDKLLSIQNELDEKVQSYETIDDDTNKKGKEIKLQTKKLDELAKAIHENRKKVIPEFIQQMESILIDLGMPNAKFKIDLKLSDEFYSNGKDTIELLFSANKGSEFLPLKKAASGGELSRIMLAIKSILTKYMNLPTIMFDEIDTGVSGEISTKMADIMHQMSRSMQVFSITHLPQIAAKGDNHFKVYKEDINDKTTTHLVKLNQDERIVEIAQMLGGKKISTSAIAHAKQLLN
ncbi:MAG: DNA repair protein RecN [Flavobacteriaceae bacterium]|nr:DNA repair protein RecN [Flavobacteriaceae bacterium]